MAMNYQEEAREIQQEIQEMMQGVNGWDGVPLTTEYALSFLIAGTRIERIAGRIRKTPNINKRKELINEFNRHKEIIRWWLKSIIDDLYGRQLWVEQGGPAREAGIMESANMP